MRDSRDDPRGLDPCGT